jgi:hypothetical protein
VSRFDGLDLYELIELMHGVTVPDPVSMMPITPGWWILFAWLLVVSLLAVLHFLQRYRRNQYRREALLALDAIDQQKALSPDKAAQLIATLLKRTALAAYPREDVAALIGQDWADFLVKSANTDPKIADAAPMLATSAYRPDADGRLLSGPARRWIQLHRA